MLVSVVSCDNCHDGFNVILLFLLTRKTEYASPPSTVYFNIRHCAPLSLTDLFCLNQLFRNVYLPHWSNETFKLLDPITQGVHTLLKINMSKLFMSELLNIKTGEILKAKGMSDQDIVAAWFLHWTKWGGGFLFLFALCTVYLVSFCFSIVIVRNIVKVYNNDNDNNNNYYYYLVMLSIFNLLLNKDRFNIIMDPSACMPMTILISSTFIPPKFQSLASYSKKLFIYFFALHKNFAWRNKLAF